MEISLDKHAINEASIKIKLNEADYQPKVDAKIKEYARKANIKGFRPGKAPFALIKNMYGTSVLVEEINQMLSSSLNDYLKKQEFRVVGDPLPKQESAEDIDWKKQKEFEFEYKIGFVEGLSIPIDENLKVKKFQVEVSNEEVQEALGNIKKQYGKMTNPELSEGGDYLYGDLKAKNGSLEKSVSLPIEKMDGRTAKKFIGVEKEAEITFDPSKAFKVEDLADLLDISNEEAEAIEGDYTFTVKNINRTEEASLDQELFDKVLGEGQVSSEEDFLAKIKEIIGENYNKEAEVFTQEEIKKSLLEKADIQLPEEFLKEWLIRSNEEKVSEDEVKKEYPAYARHLSWALISNKIAEENEIKAEHDEVVEKTKQMIRENLASSGMMGQMEDNMDMFVNNYLQGKDGQNYMQMLTSVQNDKVLAFVLEKAAVEEETISPEEFKKLLEN